MGSIQLLTDNGLQTVLFDGDQPSPRDMAELRKMFPYEQQLPMNEMGGTQTMPMTPTLPEAPPEPAPPPELKPDTLTPEQQEMAKAQTRQYEQSMQGPDMGTVATKLVRPRFAGEQPSQGEVAAGKGVARAVAGTTAFAKGMLGDEEGASRIDENLSNIPYEPGVAGLAEAIIQFSTIASPVGAVGKVHGASRTARSLVGSGAAGMLAFSGKQAKLSDMFQEYPSIANPVTEYLASDEDDSFLEGRLKNALEFAGLDAAVIGAFALTLKSLKGVAKLKPNGEAKLADELSKDVPKANPNHVVRPPKNGKVQVAHAGQIQLPDKVVVAINKPFQKTLELGSKFVPDKVLKPLKQSIERISPRIAHGMDRFELDGNLLTQAYMQRAVPMFDVVRKIRKANKGDAAKLEYHVFNSEFVEANQILQKYKNNGIAPGAMREFRDVNQLGTDLHKLGNDNGIVIQYRQNHFPRILKDHEGFMKSIGKDVKDPIDEAIDEAFRAKNKVGKGQPLPTTPVKLTQFEEREVIREYLEGSMYKNQAASKFSHSKERVIEKIKPEHMKFYGSFEENLTNYISNLTYRVAKNRYTGKVPGVPGYHDEIARLRQGKKIDTKQGVELERLIGVRLTGGEQSIGVWAKIYRDFLYLTSIGNPISTITQASELLLNAYRNGMLTTLQTLGKTATGKGIRIKDLGLEDIAKEFSDPLSRSQAGIVGGFQKKLNNTLNKTLGSKAVLFKQMDVFAKESALNGALLKAQKQLAKKNSPEYKKFAQEQAKFFEGETQGLIDAIKRGDSNDPNVKVFLFSKLSRTQPISLSEYPEVYLKYPFLRPAYFLKSFGLKQLETTRREVLRKIGSGNAKEIKEGWRQALRLSVLFGTVGMGGNNLFKDYILDRDDKPGMTPTLPTGEKAWHAVLDGLLTLIGLSRYSGRKIADPNKRAEGIWDLFLPPKATEIISGDVFTNEKNIPIVGKVYSEHWGSSAEYKRKQRKKGRKKTALD